MIPTVIVNALTIVHKKSDGVATSGAPDVCKTPSAGGPIPIPYVNVAFSKDLQNGSTTVSADGVPAALKDSFLLPSVGDEPGVLGGVASGVNKGKAKFINYSMDVMIEGRNVARLTDPMTMNGNGPNTMNPAETQGNLGALGGNKRILCKIFCWCDAGKGGGDFVQKLPPGVEIA
jgi:uncharacterized Zn-binding protein involved in type VI secretion